MNNVLKATLVYTGAYFIFCLVYWLVLVTLNLFWKPIALFAVVLFTLLGIDYALKRNDSEASSFMSSLKKAAS